ncbi:DUF6221 family protein [Streptomyces sp. NPDC051994]|uniref:DUF6221 family protein n=1 Tax=unclassified Streptomyces TaxID=2593676 RepID=UPI00343376A4
MDALVQFVRDRLDEEAEAARKAGGDAWRFDAVDSAGGVVFDSRDRPIMESASDPGRSHGHDRTAADHHQAAHAVRHNPARVLAEVEAKRRILDGIAGADAEGAYITATFTAMDVLRLLALPYAGHPGYREEWRP